MKRRRRISPFRARLHIVVAVAVCLAHPAGAQTYPTQNTIGFDVMIKNEVEAAGYFKSEVASWGKMTRAIGYSSD